MIVTARPVHTPRRTIHHRPFKDLIHFFICRNHRPDQRFGASLYSRFMRERPDMRFARPYRVAVGSSPPASDAQRNAAPNRDLALERGRPQEAATGNDSCLYLAHITATSEKVVAEGRGPCMLLGLFLQCRNLGRGDEAPDAPDAAPRRWGWLVLAWLAGVIAIALLARLIHG
jgi:hypothetical protein